MTAVPPPATARLDVDLDALAANYYALKARAGVPVHPVVKADAYGLGAGPVARRLIREGADTFFVARLGGGVKLRAALGSGPLIYVLDGCASGARACLIAHELRPVLNSHEQLRAWDAGGPCAIQIDTGMNRLGFEVADLPREVPALSMVLSHLSCADDPAAPGNEAQRALFAQCDALYPGVSRSLANSGGVFLGHDYARDAVRPGLSLYGIEPTEQPGTLLRPVASLHAMILQVRKVRAGTPVGYGGAWRAPRDTRIATIGIGYADGFGRSHFPDGAVHGGGRLLPLAGRISMDLTGIDLGDTALEPGDWVEIFGADRRIEDAARAAGTISYELLTGIGPRVERRYLGQP